MQLKSFGALLIFGGALLFSGIVAPPILAQKTLADALAGLKPQSGDAGLLLGFDTDSSENAEGYGQFYDYSKPAASVTATNKTLFIARRSDKIALAANLDYIACPQKNGFVYLGQTRYFEPTPRVKNPDFDDSNIKPFGFDYTRVWQTASRAEIPIVQTRVRAQIKSEIDRDFRRSKDKEFQQNITDYEKLSFVGDGFYMKTGFWSQITGGAAFFDAYDKAKTVFLTTQKFSIRLQDYYSKAEIIKYYRQNLVDAYSFDNKLTDDEKAGRVEDLQTKLDGKPVWGWGTPAAEKTSDGVSVPSFRLSRVAGKTVIEGFFMMEGNSHRSFHETFNLSAARKPLVNYDNPSVDFAAFKAIYPQMVDVFVSPNQNTIIVLTDAEIIGIDVATQKEIFKQAHNLKFNKVIMIDWATGNFVGKWANELK